MTSKKYLKKKNKLVKRVTGLVLVPKDQIKKHPFVLLKDMYATDMLHEDICTYCILYADDMCISCPMHKADNECNYNSDSTWRRANDSWVAKATKEDQKELSELVQQYNREEGK